MSAGRKISLLVASCRVVVHKNSNGNQGIKFFVLIKLNTVDRKDNRHIVFGQSFAVVQDVVPAESVVKDKFIGRVCCVKCLYNRSDLSILILTLLRVIRAEIDERADSDFCDQAFDLVVGQNV